MAMYKAAYNISRIWWIKQFRSLLSLKNLEIMEMMLKSLHQILDPGYYVRD